MVINNIDELKQNFMFLSNEALDLYSLASINLQKKVLNKKSWEYATYVYIKRTFFEKKNKYKRLYKLVCEIENILNRDVYKE